MPVPGPPPEGVAVLFDYENVARTAGRAFLDFGEYLGYGHVKPWDLAQLIVKKRRRPSFLHQVRVFRGRPNPHRQPESARAFDRQRTSWEDAGVRVFSRNLFYSDEWPTRPAIEKGIDVSVAVHAMELAYSGTVKAIVMMSHDNDLLPAVEAIMQRSPCHIEVAAWSGTNSLRVEGGGPWCHFLSEADFRAVRDETEYAAPAR